MRAFAYVLPALLLAPACKKKEAEPASAEPVAAAPAPLWPEGTPTHDKVAEKWKAEGLEVADFSPTDAAKYGASQCFAGKVGGVEALLCGYAERRQIRRAQEAILEWAQGARTVVIDQRRNGQLALVDRAGADPTGKTIDKASSLFMFLR